MSELLQHIKRVESTEKHGQRTWTRRKETILLQNTGITSIFLKNTV